MEVGFRLSFRAWELCLCLGNSVRAQPGVRVDFRVPFCPGRHWDCNPWSLEGASYRSTSPTTAMTMRSPARMQMLMKTMSLVSWLLISRASIASPSHCWASTRFSAWLSLDGSGPAIRVTEASFLFGSHCTSYWWMSSWSPTEKSM